MIVFKYIGRTATGRVKKGIIHAETKADAIAKLRRNGINPREVTESTSIFHKQITVGKAVKTEDFVIYCRQFATLIRAGIPIVESTNILAKQTSSKGLKQALHTVEEDVRAGTSFSDATAKLNKIFPSMFVNMVRAGEATGNLDDTLDRLAFYYEKQFTLKKKVQSTMMYPLILALVTIGVVLFLMLLIVPTFTDMLADFEASLPYLTIVVVNISNIIKNFWWVLTLALLVMIVTVHYLFKK